MILDLNKNQSPSVFDPIFIPLRYTLRDKPEQNSRVSLIVTPLKMSSGNMSSFFQSFLRLLRKVSIQIRLV